MTMDAKRARRRKWIVGGIILGIIVVVAVVLGAVLGTVLPAKGSNATVTPNNSTQTSQYIVAKNQTGIASAMLADGSNTLLTYFQSSANNDILEKTYNGTWSAGPWETGYASVVVTDAGARTPIAAISYPDRGRVFRQVFYTDTNGNLKQTNKSSTDTAWSNSSILTSIQVGTGDWSTAGIAACWLSHGMGATYKTSNGSTQTYGGIRLYYGAVDGLIHELGWAFDTAHSWDKWYVFNGSDANAGVGCAIHDAIVNVYMRNTTTSALQQWWFDYDHPEENWNIGPSYQGISTTSSIAASNDNSSVELVYFQAPDLSIRSLSNAISGNTSTFTTPAGKHGLMPNGYRLSTTWVGKNGTTALLSQRTDLGIDVVQYKGSDQQVSANQIPKMD
ncbi:hypothetical protein LTR16_000315 [Cryomyces antarcticus]|uniref:Fucose-specific lectin n=1 Tax=Cryomyces antarcticus TaxID=329879 RepID=A0ABR0KW26_9PEZI|nr:hypothetical protein LTR39_000170 [Cryomyces antarcticus]KAK5021169.1 hypothetical protein LTR60_000091 [Cryomyces antarcticus]KAK5131880.1 hypothetical protein LTR16_000315 [Cryomyces antarcticus]